MLKKYENILLSKGFEKESIKKVQLDRMITKNFYINKNVICLVELKIGRKIGDYSLYTGWNKEKQYGTEILVWSTIEKCMSKLSELTGEC